MHSCRQQTKNYNGAVPSNFWRKSIPYFELHPQPNFRSSQRANKDIFRQARSQKFYIAFILSLKALAKYTPEEWGHKLRKWNTGNRRPHSEEKWRNWQEDEEADPRWRLWPGTRVKEAAYMQLGRLWPGFPPEDKNKRIAGQSLGL